jgi:hypothetical protein
LYDKAPSYQHEIQTTTFATKFQQTMDPMERANIYVGQSRLVPVGERMDAIFAKVDIPAYTVVAFYAGTLVVDHSVSLLLSWIRPEYSGKVAVKQESAVTYAMLKESDWFHTRVSHMRTEPKM